MKKTQGESKEKEMVEEEEVEEGCNNNTAGWNAGGARMCRLGASNAVRESTKGSRDGGSNPPVASPHPQHETDRPIPENKNSPIKGGAVSPLP